MSGGLRRDVTDHESALISVLSWREDGVKIVLIALLLILPSLLHLVHVGLLLSLGLLVGDASRNQHGGIVFHKGLLWLRHALFEIQKVIIT